MGSPEPLGCPENTKAEASSPILLVVARSSAGYSNLWIVSSLQAGLGTFFPILERTFLFWSSPIL